ncbi:MAG: hypothetical protein PHW37_03830 [Acholeplasmataceae bacterium]|nr:hypothetical protein [Acholeplasmataceae bacterium]MDD4194380.1 hypothetical protein [Acholeplasmataceae bacterium]
MNVIKWLLRGDESVSFLTRKYLTDQSPIQENQGFIKRYLDLYHFERHMFGDGVYGPKWISTHYTMLELKYMEISFDHPIYQDALLTLLKYEWQHHGMYNKNRHQDMCIVGMLLSLACYGKSKDPKIEQMIDYILEHQFLDGGWNCTWEFKNPKISSVHTTLSILEGLNEYVMNQYQYRIDEIKQKIKEGENCLLNRHLYLKSSLDGPIDKHMSNVHYPPRWKYDFLRALEYFSNKNYPFDHRMGNALNHLKFMMHGPYLKKGSKISGIIHFQLEDEKFGRFNTLRALKVIKTYDFPLYKKLII